MSGDTQPTQPLPDPQAQWVLAPADPSRAEPRRRRRWGWIVALLIVVVSGSSPSGSPPSGSARTLVTSTIQSEVANRLSLAPEDVDVTVDGAGACRS